MLVVPFASSVDHESMMTLDPVDRSTPLQMVEPHGVACGSVFTVSADERSAGIHRLTLCSDVATDVLPFVLEA